MRFWTHPHDAHVKRSPVAFHEQKMVDWPRASGHVGIFPVDAGTAAAMGVPQLPVACSMQAAAVAGNAMHLGSVSVMQLLGLSCFRQFK